jgi:hypothetical protein
MPELLNEFTMVKKINLLVAVGLSCILWCGNAGAQQTWKMKTIPVATDWAATVSPDNALTEYPRPQMTRRNWLISPPFTRDRS